MLETGLLQNALSTGGFVSAGFFLSARTTSKAKTLQTLQTVSSRSTPRWIQFNQFSPATVVGKNNANCNRK